MIKYHGAPFGGTKSEAAEALIGRHAFISFAAPSHLDVCLEVCQSVALDNGAFTAWKQGKEVDWNEYFKWAGAYVRNPCVDWAIIPDVIDSGKGAEGDEEANLKLIARWHEWFHTDGMSFGVPVWHMHESDTKLKYLSHAYKRIAIGSSAEFSKVGSEKWHERMTWAMRLICDANGQPKTKLHMLRGLDPAVFQMYPFASADSTNAARNCNIETAWKGTYAPPSNSWRARVIMARTEAYNSCQNWKEPLPEWLASPLTDLFGCEII
jgi:hypothetical protein